MFPSCPFHQLPSPPGHKSWRGTLCYVGFGGFSNSGSIKNLNTNRYLATRSTIHRTYRSCLNSTGISTAAPLPPPLPFCPFFITTYHKDESFFFHVVHETSDIRPQYVRDSSWDLFWLRLVAYCDVHVEHSRPLSIGHYIGFRVAFLAEHKCLPGTYVAWNSWLPN